MQQCSGRALVRVALFAIGVLGCAAATHAQSARVGGVVMDEEGAPIAGAQVVAENPQVSPGRFKTETDDRGRFSMIGLRAGIWTFTASARGFAPSQGTARVQTLSANPPVDFKLVRGAAGYVGVLTNVNTKELQAELQSADTLYNSGQYDRAIAAYRAVLAKVPSLTAINLQIGNAYRQKKDFDRAIAAYGEVLKTTPGNDKARLYLALTHLEKGDTAAAAPFLEAVASTPAATREVFYNLGEIRFSGGQKDEAAKWYEKAAAADPRWAKPVYKLALVAINKGDKPAAAGYLEKVLAIDASSPEAAQAKTLLAELAQK